jgi:hypothetical protein
MGKKLEVMGFFFFLKKKKKKIVFIDYLGMLMWCGMIGQEA